jgi:hypothetical protein
MRDNKHTLPSPDTFPELTQLERTMLASIALMKRIRRERRRAPRAQGQKQ